MARATGPLQSIGAQKQLAHSLIFKQKGSKSFVTGYNKPGGRNRLTISAAQLDKRMLFNIILARWQTFTENQKATWNDDNRTKTLQISGWNLFYREALKDLPTYLGLQGYWSFNKIVGGKILDLSGNANHGVLKPAYPTNCPTLINSLGPKFGKAGSFDGDDDYINLGTDINGDGDISIEYWFNFTKGSTQVSTNKDNAWRIFLESFNLAYTYFYVNGSWNNNKGNLRYSLTDVTSGVWHHAVSTYEQSTGLLKAYLNGTLKATLDLETNEPIAQNSNTAYLGAQYLTTYNVNGSLDEVRIYSRALSLTEIQKHYQLITKK